MAKPVKGFASKNAERSPCVRMGLYFRILYNFFMTFRPLPFLGNPHVQTILGNLAQGPRVRWPTSMHVVPLCDGDALAAHDTVPPSWHPGDSIVILVHGLGGSHR